MVQVASASVGRCQHQHAAPLKRTQMRKIVVSLGYWKNAVKSIKQFIFILNFLQFQIVYRGPQMTPSRAASGPWAASLRPLA